MCWQGYVQAVEEVPSSSASSVAPSAATTPAAAKTAASIQEFNDEQEPGWIFGVMGGSVASVTTGTDDLWDELVLDSGSVSTAWLESKVQMVAPIEEVAAEEMEIDDDGEGAGVARAEPRADDPGDEPPPPRP